MPEYEKVCTLQSQVEAITLETILKEREIPYFLRSYEDSAYDGLYQLGKGWGHIEAAPEHAEEIRSLVEGIRKEGGEASDPVDSSANKAMDRKVLLLCVAIVIAGFVIAWVAR